MPKSTTMTPLIKIALFIMAMTIFLLLAIIGCIWAIKECWNTLPLHCVLVFGIPLITGVIFTINRIANIDFKQWAKR